MIRLLCYALALLILGPALTAQELGVDTIQTGRKRTPLKRPTLDAETIAEIQALNKQVLAALESKSCRAESIQVGSLGAHNLNQLVVSEGPTTWKEGKPQRELKEGQPDAPEVLEAHNEMPDDSRAIFGRDDRGLPRFKTPYTLVGRLITADGSSCTASLIGPRHIITAAHCFSEVSPGRLNPAVFIPFYDLGACPLGQANVVHVYQGSLNAAPGTSGDFAVCILDKYLGRDLGYFGYHSIDPRWFDHSSSPLAQFIMAGYSGDWYMGERMGADWGARLYWRLQEDPFVVGHDGDTTPGSSGGPLFGYFPKYGWCIVAINIAEPAGPTGGRIVKWKAEAPTYGFANLCIDISYLAPVIKRALEDFP